MGIDLHIHTNCSDGNKSPTQIVQMALCKRLSAIAITDHDTVEGITEATHAAEASELEVVPGVELSVNWKEKAVHLLSYYFDLNHEKLHENLVWIQEGRKMRNEQVLAKLVSLGFEITEEELQLTAGPGLVGRPHFAQLLIKKGYVRNMEEAFRLYLGMGAKAYIPRRSMGVAEAVAMLHQAGGVAVVAHPFTLGYSEVALDREIAEMAEVGLDGLEVFYPKHSKAFKNKLEKIAQKYSLITTGGSDYHGDVRHGGNLAGGKNVFVSHYILEKLKERQQAICEQKLKNSDVGRV